MTTQLETATIASSITVSEPVPQSPSALETERRVRDAVLGGAMIAGFNGQNSGPEVDRAPLVEIRNGLEIREIPGTERFYNAGVWEVDGKTYMLGRNSIGPGKDGEPDFNSVELRVLDENLQTVFSKEIWPLDESRQTNLEDARVMLLDSGELVIGFTYVVKRGKKRYVPLPAVVVVPSTSDLIEGPSPEIRVITELGTGDQTSPIGEILPEKVIGKGVTAINKELFLFRPDGKENNHTLVVFRINEEGKAIKIQGINFPKMAWNKNRIGPAGPPIPLNIHDKRLSVQMLHGSSPDEKGILDYFLSPSRMTLDSTDDGEAHITIDKLSPNHLIGPELFSTQTDNANGGESKSKYGNTELHEGKHVVYSTGQIAVYDNAGELVKVHEFVTLGDHNMKQVTVTRERLTEGWEDEPAISEQELSAVA